MHTPGRTGQGGFTLIEAIILVILINAVFAFVQEYRAERGLSAVVNRCGVVAGPWQMGKVDQGVFTHWLLAHQFERVLAGGAVTDHGVGAADRHRA